MASAITSTIASWFLPLKRKLEVEDKECPALKKPCTEIYVINGDITITTKFATPVTFQLESIAKSEEHSMGWLKTLPLELLHIIFRFLDKNSLLLLSSTSKDMNASILTYLMSAKGLRHLLSKQYSSTRITNITRYNFDMVKTDLFSKAGKLFGRITSSHTLTRRLRIASNIKERLEPTYHNVAAIAGSTKSHECFGQLFYHYISDWIEFDKLRAFCLFERITKLQSKITRVLRYAPGSLPWHEWELRQLLRYTLLEPSTSDEEYGFWLTQILRPHPITHQARLLYILTGPTDNAGFICWNSTCGCISMTTANTLTMQTDLSELAHACKVLLVNRSEWSMDDIISIFDELTTIPCGWCLEKVAILLASGGNELCQAVMGNRAMNGHVQELSVILYYMAHQCVKEDGENASIATPRLSWYITLLKYIAGVLPDREKRLSFSTHLLSSWQDYLTCLFDEDNDISEETDYEEVRKEFCVSITCLTQLSIALVNTIME